MLSAVALSTEPINSGQLSQSDPIVEERSQGRGLQSFQQCMPLSSDYYVDSSGSFLRDKGKCRAQEADLRVQC